MDVLHRLIQNPNSQHEPLIMSFLCSLSTNSISFEVDNLYFRGNLDNKLLFQQSSMDMGVVRLQNDTLVFIPIGGTAVAFTITQAVVLNNNTSSSESSIELSPSIINSQCNPNLKY